MMDIKQTLLNYSDQSAKVREQLDHDVKLMLKDTQLAKDCYTELNQLIVSNTDDDSFGLSDKIQACCFLE